MGAKRGELRRAARDDAKLDGYVDSGFIPWAQEGYHGVCRGCGRRRSLNRPLLVCDKCMPTLAAFVYAARFFGVTL